MRLSARYIVFCGLFLSALSLFGQKEDWLPITPNDLAMKQAPGSPGADAVQLYYADFINDQEQSEFFYQRIKVLNEKGNRFARRGDRDTAGWIAQRFKGAHDSPGRKDY